ncbi:MAG TPA: hypothetical protein VGR47_13655 [Terracidiphilus sp.]|nr:hypothetical protein [Terracidiphilus sp.]
MTVCDDCFNEFLHPLVHELSEKSERFKERYGDHQRWHWDDESATLTFTDPEKPTLVIDVTVVGTTEGNSWEWTWANANFPAHTKIGMDTVREYGETQGYHQLTSAFLDADEYTGWEMTAIAAHLLNALGAYRFPTDSGFCYVVYRKLNEIAGAKHGERPN